MPWTVDDVDRFEEGLTQEQKEQWVAIANDVLERCLNDGGDRQECEASAIKQASGSVGNRQNAGGKEVGDDGMVKDLSSVIVHNEGTRARDVVWEGRKHIAVPVVLLVEGVHNSLFYPADELAAFPQSWNGIPVPIQHPEGKDGGPSTCNDPEVIVRQNVGRLWNVVYEDGKLKGEVWVDVAKADALEPGLVRALRSGIPLDVSTGLWADEEPVSGTWNEEEYNAIVRNFRPDHLALLPGAVGACSWEDGCGVRANQQGKGGDMKGNIRSNARSPSYEGTEKTSWGDVSKTMEDFVDGYYKNTSATKPDDPVGAVDAMPAEMKRWIANRSLLGEASAEDFDNLVFFPVVNPSTNKLNEGALKAVISGRGAQADIPDSAKDSAQAKARTLLKDEFDFEVEPQGNEEEEDRKVGLLRRLSNALGKLFQAQEDISHDDLRSKLQGVVDGMDRVPSQTEELYHFVQEVYDDFFIYMMASPETGADGAKLFKQQYALSDDGEVALQGEPVEVELRTEYVEVTQNADAGDQETNQANPNRNQDCPPCGEANTNSEEDNKMTKEEMIKSILEIEGTPFCEDDREYLNGLAEDKLAAFHAKLAPTEPGSSDAGDTDPGGTPAEDVAGDSEDGGGAPAPDTLEAKPKTADEVLAEMPTELREMFSSGLKLHNSRRTSMVNAILANKKSKYTKEQLEAKPMDELETLAALAAPEVSFEANAGSDAMATNEEDEQETAPPPPKPKWNRNGTPDYSHLNS